MDQILGKKLKGNIVGTVEETYMSSVYGNGCNVSILNSWFVGCMLVISERFTLWWNIYYSVCGEGTLCMQIAFKRFKNRLMIMWMEVCGCVCVFVLRGSKEILYICNKFPIVNKMYIVVLSMYCSNNFSISLK